MPYSYQQSTGLLRWQDVFVERGYSGFPPHVNDPEAQNLPDLGPIPVGWWEMGEAILHPQLGPLAIPLTPQPETETFGRSGFYIHCDEIGEVGKQLASHGCIILSHATRVTLNLGLYKLLEV